ICARGRGRMALDLSMPILVVDDYGTMIRIIRNLLKQLGFDNVDDAPDGASALTKMRGRRYGLVISDWNMEPMTGLPADPVRALTSANLRAGTTAEIPVMPGFFHTWENNA